MVLIFAERLSCSLCNDSAVPTWSLDHLNVNSQAARESFLHTEGVFRQLSNKDVLKLSIHPPLPPPKILWRIPSCKFRVQGVSDIMYSGELWGACPPFLSSFVLPTRFYAELIAFIRLIIDYQSLIHYLTCSDWQFKYLRPFFINIPDQQSLNTMR